ncbi:Hsp70 family protein [Dactylosporangium sp. CA-139066]|uniref:Hsp70 family protein n=1 Tax=Dactylosporangium sp. CA-139066 TaxID=3239930 RepID=UPI003D8AC400
MVRWNGFGVGVDLGTSNTVAVGRWADGRTRPLMFDGQPLLQSAVYLDPSGNLVTGRDADRMAQADPARYEPNPKRRIDDGVVLLGGREVPVVDMLAALLGRVALTAREAFGFVPAVALTYPAAWGTARRQTLTLAAQRAGFATVRLVPEPIAAARYFTEVVRHPVPPGGTLAVFDFGGGTLDVALVRAQPGGFAIVAAGGADDLGGLDIDEALVGHLGALLSREHPQAWRQISAPADDLERRHRKAFWDDVRAAKEMLSRSATAPVPIPGVSSSLHVTREELEALAGQLVRRAAAEVTKLLRTAGVRPAELHGIFLVGGASRVPLVARALHAELGVAPTVLEQPELPVAEGALADLAHAERVTSGIPVQPAPVPAAPVPAAPVPVRTAPAPLPMSVPPAAVSPVSPAAWAPPPRPPVVRPPRRKRGRAWLIIGPVLLALLAGLGVVTFKVYEHNVVTFDQDPKTLATVTVQGAGKDQFMWAGGASTVILVAQVGRQIEAVFADVDGRIRDRRRLGDAERWERAQEVSGNLLAFSAPDGAGKRQAVWANPTTNKNWTLAIGKDDQLMIDPHETAAGLVWRDLAKGDIVVVDVDKGTPIESTRVHLSHGEKILNEPTEPVRPTFLIAGNGDVSVYDPKGAKTTPYKVAQAQSQAFHARATVFGQRGDLFTLGDTGIGRADVSALGWPGKRGAVWLGHCAHWLCSVTTDDLGTPVLNVFPSEIGLTSRYEVQIPGLLVLGSPPVTLTEQVPVGEEELLLQTGPGTAGAAVLRVSDGKILGRYEGYALPVFQDAVLVGDSDAREVVPGYTMTGIDVERDRRTTVKVGDVRPATCVAWLTTLTCAREHDFVILQVRHKS